jgi:hypothetical protein
VAILNYRFGSLNQVQKSDTFSDYRTNETSGVSTLKNLAADNFTPDIFSNIQIFKGICLRIYDESTWSAVARTTPMMSPSELTRIVVRIPELHAMICDPFEHVKPDGTLDQRLVDQHPTFIASSVQLDRPKAPGQVVNVSFDDVENQLGGQYLGVVLDEPTPWIPRNNTSKNFFKRPRLPDLNASDSNFVALASSRAKRADRSGEPPPPPTDLYPGSTWTPAYQSRREPIKNHKHIVIHTVGRVGDGNIAVRHFQNAHDPGVQTSVHFVILPGGHVVQMLDPTKRGVHAGGLNRTSIGIEHSAPGDSGPDAAFWDGALGQKQLKSSAKLVKWLNEKYNIPIKHSAISNSRPQEKGVVGHSEIDRRTGDDRHHDPGVDFPWAQYIKMIEEA